MMDPQKVADWAVRLLITNPFPGKSQRELVEIITACRLQKFSGEQTILNEGDPGDELYFLMEGQVTVLKKDTNGEERQLVVMQAPTMFGHMSLVDGSPRSATCRAEGEVIVAVLSRKTYLDLLSRSHPVGTSLRRLMLSTLTRQLVDGNARLFDLIGGEVPVAKKPAPSARSSKPGSGTRVPSRVVKKGATKSSASPADTRASRSGSSRADQDVSRSDLLEMAGILNGWKVDDQGLDDIEFIETEDDRRRSGKTSS
jgi:CRP-like cAMP-binding protein